MISIQLADLVMVISLLITIFVYVKLSKIEGSYINVLLPSLITGIPAFYFLPWLYMQVFGTGSTRYAFFYVYATLAAENVAFVYAFSRTRGKVIRLPFRFSYGNFALLAWICLGLAILIYVPLLLQFGDLLLDPREIYRLTRTGFGVQYYISSILAYLSVVLILFTTSSWLTKTVGIGVATWLVLLHGSKGQVLNIVLLLILFHVYGAGKKVGLGRAVIACSAIAVVVLLLFAGTMSFGDGPLDAIESISEYSDYTRNAFLVIDQHYPLQYGRLTLESNLYGLIPRALMPNKPKNFGAFRLADEFHPESFDADKGSPDYGIGMQYADFGALAIAYLALFSMLKGWFARVFVNRLKLTHHPADFFIVAFSADVTLFPVGGIGWFLPGAVLVALFLRFVSRIGADKVYLEPYTRKTLPAPTRMLGPASSTSF